MKKIVNIVGLDCPNCATALEKEINKLEGIRNAEINFIKNRLVFESDNVDIALNKICKLVKQIEPQAKITTNSNLFIHKDIIIDLICFSLGAISALLCFLFDSSKCLFIFLFTISSILFGYRTYYKAIRLLIKGIVNENLLLTISVLGAALIGEYLESLMVIALYSIGKIFESLALSKSRKSVEALTDLHIDTVTLILNDQEILKEPTEVKKGSLIIVKPGERIPIDGVVVKGNATLDLQSLTGESMPVNIHESQSVLSGSIVLDGVLYIKTTCEYKDSSASRIMDLITIAGERKSKTETLISRIAKWYTLGVIILAITVFCMFLIFTNDLELSIYRGLIFLVVSCPCAFAISVPLTYFSGLGNAAKNGILIKGSNYLDVCSKVSMIAFDKTGTLTTGEFSVVNVISANNYTNQDVIFYAAMGEQNSNHPLAKAILKRNRLPLSKVDNVKEIAGEGIYYTYKGENYFVGSKNKDHAYKNTLVEVHKGDEKVGDILLSDTIKTTGEYTVKIKLFQGIIADLKIIVEI